MINKHTQQCIFTAQHTQNLHHFVPNLNQSLNELEAYVKLNEEVTFALQLILPVKSVRQFGIFKKKKSSPLAPNGWENGLCLCAK